MQCSELHKQPVYDSGTQDAIHQPSAMQDTEHNVSVVPMQVTCACLGCQACHKACATQRGGKAYTGNCLCLPVLLLRFREGLGEWAGEGWAEDGTVGGQRIRGGAQIQQLCHVQASVPGQLPASSIY